MSGVGEKLVFVLCEIVGVDGEVHLEEWCVVYEIGVGLSVLEMQINVWLNEVGFMDRFIVLIFMGLGVDAVPIEIHDCYE